MKFISTQATERLEGDVFVEDIGEGENRDLEEGLLVPRAVYSAINNIYCCCCKQLWVGKH